MVKRTDGLTRYNSSKDNGSVQNLHPVTSALSGYGPLNEKDTTVSPYLFNCFYIGWGSV